MRLKIKWFLQDLIRSHKYFFKDFWSLYLLLAIEIIILIILYNTVVLV